MGTCGGGGGPAIKFSDPSCFSLLLRRAVLGGAGRGGAGRGGAGRGGAGYAKGMLGVMGKLVSEQVLFTGVCTRSGPTPE